MSEIATIERVADHVGNEITIRGWLYARNGKGKLQLLHIRDGTGILQCVLLRKEVTQEVFDAALRLTQESSLIVSGTIRAAERAGGIPGGFEMEVTGLQAIQAVRGEYPIGTQDRGGNTAAYLAQNRHLWIRSSRQWATLRVRATVIQALRGWLDGHGFVQVDTPVPVPVTSEEPTDLFDADFRSTPAYLEQAAQLYNEASIMAFGRVYRFGPAFRADADRSRRHVQEVWMVEPVAAFVDMWENMEIQEQLVSSVVRAVLHDRRKELELLGRNLASLESVAPPFARMHYDEAVAIVNKAAAEGATTPSTGEPVPPIAWGTALSVAQAAYVAEQLDRPVFLHHYPAALSAFYVTQEPDRQETCRASGLLVAEGYGEIAAGSERTADLAFLEAQIDRLGMPRDAYEWYLDLRRYGSVPHAGFGLELEHTVMWICGLDSIPETIPYPRVQGRPYP